MLTQRAVALAACTWTLSSCMPRPVETPVPTSSTVGGGVEVPAGAEALRVDPDRSVVTILVRRAGALARLGHNHAIVSASESGVAWIGRDLAGSGFEIRLPVQAFVVDDPQARAGAGPEFAEPVSDSARQGTYANMLRAEVLDGARYPEVIVSARRVDGNWDDATVKARVTLRGATRDVDLPITLRREPATLGATGVMRIRQTDFGITPFSIAAGAVQVADELEVRFEIVARRR
ncbi:MAG: YceI family protein [Steroidobacteraceae bacterium]